MILGLFARRLERVFEIVIVFHEGVYVEGLDAVFGSGASRFRVGFAGGGLGRVRSCVVCRKRSIELFQSGFVDSVDRRRREVAELLGSEGRR